MDAEPGGSVEFPWFLKLHWGWLVAAFFLQTFLSVALPPRLQLLTDLMIWWPLLQSGWLRKVDRRSNAVYWYGTSLILMTVPWHLVPGLSHAFLPVTQFVRIPTVADALALAGFLLWISTNFVLRSDMLRYFNGVNRGRVRMDRK